eukprot:TRINITY_DN3820_c0_g1_i2.p1 TRINITY_DN3820_c0_g1~~TRINITY_DN3820_c0_g1_i2.p1  ORF type:complete len:493 (+),score=102.68 TRINITY_DN3820_c0_g1_i2:98-1576(+)
MLTANFLRRSSSLRLASPKGRSFASRQNVDTISAMSILDEVSTSKKEMVKIAVCDIDGVLRGKYVNRDKFNSVAKGGLGFCSVVFGWDCADVLYDNTKEVGWHMGYSDFTASLDLNTYRKVPWEDDVPFFLGDFYDPAKGKALEMCPRSLLKKVLAQTKSTGHKAYVGAEFEFFNYKETPQSVKEKKFVQPEPITPGMFGYSLLRTSRNRELFWAMMNQLPKFGIPIEGIHTETGPGVYEAAIQFGEALEAADRAVLFKTAVKEIARDFGVMPTFMAKPSSSLPGCGGHLHINLADEATGTNTFYDANDPNKMSQQFKHFLAGMIYCAPEIMPMFAPNVNSYKRFVEGYWAPTTPTWGVENRTVSFRVIPASSKSTRVEIRLPGADMNAYLAVSASIASGLYGIRNKLPLQTAVTGNAYGAAPATAKVQVSDRDKLPRNLGEASERMANSKVAKEIFGETFVDHFTSTRIWEWRQYQSAVTNWETERYFEII